MLRPDSTLRLALERDAPEGEYGAGWTLDQHLLALAVDGLKVLAWQKTKDGRKGRNRPTPISPLLRAAVTRIGRTERPPEQVKAYLDQFAPRRD